MSDVLTRASVIDGLLDIKHRLGNGPEPFLAAISDTDTALRRQLEAAQQAKDGAYAERNRLVALLASWFPSSIEQHVGADWEDDWRNVVFIDLPTGQVSWHIHDSELPLFAHVPHNQRRTWDGHTNDEKWARVAAAQQQAEPSGNPGQLSPIEDVARVVARDESGSDTETCGVVAHSTAGQSGTTSSSDSEWAKVTEEELEASRKRLAALHGAKARGEPPFIRKPALPDPPEFTPELIAQIKRESDEIAKALKHKCHEPQSAEVLSPVEYGTQLDHLRAATSRGYSVYRNVLLAHDSALRRKCAELEALFNEKAGRWEGDKTRLQLMAERYGASSAADILRKERDQARAEVDTWQREYQRMKEDRALAGRQVDELRARCGALEQALRDVLCDGTTKEDIARAKALLTTPEPDPKAEKEGAK